MFDPTQKNEYADITHPLRTLKNMIYVLCFLAILANYQIKLEGYSTIAVQ